MYLSVFICACAFVVASGVANPLVPHFRDDYKYVSSHEAFYKVHPTGQRWSEAYARCAAEGAELAYPYSDSEASVLVGLMNDSLPRSVSGIWVGAHDLYAEGIYVTLDGQEVSMSYENWHEGEPNDHNYNEDCMSVYRDTQMRDSNCQSRLPSICKKTLETLTANPPCETSDLAYIHDPEGHRCYKLHTQPKNWTQAYFTCYAEQSYLVEINSPREANILVKMLEPYPENKLNGNFNKNFIAVGFNDIIIEGEYRTTHGKPLDGCGYSEWSSDQPDDYYDNEDCGSINRNGQLNDINCATRMMFICERDIGDPNVVSLFSRFLEIRATA